MENDTPLIEPIFEKIEQFGKTSLTLYKYKAIDKSADILSSFISRFLFLLIFSLFIIFANIGLAIWLGTLFASLYIGFLCVAAVYGFIGFILYFFLHNWIKRKVSNSIILKMIN